jgi:hypothetical protein
MSGKCERVDRYSGRIKKAVGVCWKNPCVCFRSYQVTLPLNYYPIRIIAGHNLNNAPLHGPAIYLVAGKRAECIGIPEKPPIAFASGKQIGKRYGDDKNNR